MTLSVNFRILDLVNGDMAPVGAVAQRFPSTPASFRADIESKRFPWEAVL